MGSREQKPTGPSHDLIGAYLAALAAENRSPDTIRTAAGVLLLADRDATFDLGIGEATREEIRAWLGRPGRSANTKAGYFYQLAAFFAWCEAERLIDWDPMRAMAAPRRPKGIPHPCTDTELSAIMTDGRRRLQVAATLAAWGGLRCCEIARLRREDIGQAGIRVSGKGDVTRIVPAHAMVLALAETLERGSIVRQIGLKPSGHAVSGMGTYELGLLGLGGVTMHALRHWYASSLLAAGWSTLHVQQALGHASITSTQVYALVDAASIHRAVTGLPDLGLGRPG